MCFVCVFNMFSGDADARRDRGGGDPERPAVRFPPLFSVIFNRNMQKLPLFPCILTRNKGENRSGCGSLLDGSLTPHQPPGSTGNYKPLCV